MKSKSSLRYWFSEVVAALFVLLLLYTAISKFLDYKGFAKAMLHSPLIADFSQSLAYAIPTIEMAIVILLAIPLTRRHGLKVATGLMALFTSYVAYMLLASSKLPCTCGGIFEQLNWKEHLLLNSAFLMLGISSLIIENKHIIMINRSSRIPE
jgi:hypothetical protein